jgi:hypothetical protein
MAQEVRCFEVTLFWFGCDGDLDVSTPFEPDIVAIFVSKRIFDAEIAGAPIGPINGNLSLFRVARTRRLIIFSTTPGMMVLGCSGVLAVSRSCSAILADLAIRGFAIPFLTPARVAASVSFPLFLCVALVAAAATADRSIDCFANGS